MAQKTRIVRYDRELHIEAHRFRRITQPFLNHFHDYYVIGFIEKGYRHFCCKDGEYRMGPNDILLLNPKDSHSCVEISGTLDYCSLNITQDTMLSLTEKSIGHAFLPTFSKNVLHDREALAWLKPLHHMIMDDFREFQKEEYLLFLIMHLIRKYDRQDFKNDGIL